MGGALWWLHGSGRVGFRPDVFKVGINIFGVTNWLRTLKSIPMVGSFRTALYDELGDPETDSDRLTRISPLFHAKNIVSPMLVVQGANDPRVLQIESDELVEKFALTASLLNMSCLRTKAMVFANDRTESPQQEPT